VILTHQSYDNLRICGFGSGGRLGALTNTQYKPLPLSSAMPKIKSVALGQDHTVALSEDGIVYSWGLNRFAQLGYILDSPKPGAEPIQASPRKIQGPLKKESTVGVAACKTASACWTSDGHLFTWGTNDGQLGYNSLTHAVQILPKLVSSIEFRIVGIALTVCNFVIALAQLIITIGIRYGRSFSEWGCCLLYRERSLSSHI
jgi:alpha-tubulin suppressor-like RCC1 family protein